MTLFKIFTLVLFLIINVFGQEGTEVIAIIGSKSITKDEFKYRYEFTPQINRKYSDENNAKEEFLYTLIAEKLFALESEKMGFDTLNILQNTLDPLKQMYIRDALYKKEIKDNVKLDSAMFIEGMKYASYKLFVDYLYSKDEKKIDSIYNLLTSINNFDSLAPLLKGVEYVKEPYEVTYGQMFPNTEKDVYNLRVGEFTKPQQSPDGWYIFRLISKIPVAYKNAQQKISQVKKIVEGRIEDSIYYNFRNNFFKKKLINTDGALFWYLADNMQKVIVSVKEKLNLPDGEKIPIANEDFIYLKNVLNPDSLKKVFIKFDQNPVTLEKFINYFMFEGFYTFTTDPNVIASQLKSRVKRQIELELLTRYAAKKGYDNLPEVKSSTNIWRDNYLSTLYKKDIVENTKLTEQDLKDYLKNKNHLAETKYKIIEVLTDSLEVVKDALKIADNDNLLKDFAKKHSKRKSTKNNNGEFDYFTITEFEEIGKVVESMELGDVYGPLQTAEGYSVFKLIDKKDDRFSIPDSTLNENIKREIKYKKIINYLENKAAELAAKYNVKINDTLLNSLQLFNTQMVVFRYMGFGGRILAFPYSSPFYKWKEKWEQKKKDLL